MEKKLLSIIKFLYTGANFNYISKYNDSINNHINVNFHYLSNETNPRFVAITVFELQAKVSLKIKNLGKYS